MREKPGDRAWLSITSRRLSHSTDVTRALLLSCQPAAVTYVVLSPCLFSSPLFNVTFMLYPRMLLPACHSLVVVYWQSSRTRRGRRRQVFLSTINSTNIAIWFIIIILSIKVIIVSCKQTLYIRTWPCLVCLFNPIQFSFLYFFQRKSRNEDFTQLNQSWKWRKINCRQNSLILSLGWQCCW